MGVDRGSRKFPDDRRRFFATSPAWSLLNQRASKSHCRREPPFAVSRTENPTEVAMISIPRNTNVILKLVPETDADRETVLFDNLQEDLDLRTRVISFLADSHMPGLRHLRVDAQNGVVTVSGKVKTFYEKQVGGQRTRRVAGVVKFIDRIDVAMAEELATTSAS
jgi:hypothetical protein